MDVLAIYEHWPDPLTTAVIGTAISTAGVLQSAGAAAQQAASQQAVAEFNARVQKREAQAIEQQTAFRQRRAAQEGARQASRLKAAIGASGAVVSEGTPLLIQGTQLAESELDVLLIGQQGAVEAGRARSQGRLDQLQAGIFGGRIGAARTAGVLGAGTTLLTGFERVRRLRR